MERAGNGDTDPDAERRGLGTPATRAAVIEKLVKGGFAERKGKQLIPTQNGAALISVLPDMLTSPQLTAEWENNLTQIAKGAADPGEFLYGIEAMARELVQTHAAAQEDKKGLFREEKPCVRVGVPVPGSLHCREKRRFAVGLRRRCGMLRYLCGGVRKALSLGKFRQRLFAVLQQQGMCLCHVEERPFL